MAHPVSSRTRAKGDGLIVSERNSTVGVSESTQDDIGAWLGVEFTFRDRPAAVPADMRAGWRMALLLLVIDSCRGQRASLQQVQVLMRAALFSSGQQDFVRAYRGNSDPAALHIRYDPAITRAIDLAVGLDLVCWSSRNRLTLSQRGAKMLHEIVDNDDLLTKERRLLSDLGGKITMARVNKLVGT